MHSFCKLIDCVCRCVVFQFGNFEWLVLNIVLLFSFYNGVLMKTGTFIKTVIAKEDGTDQHSHPKLFWSYFF